MKQIFLLSALLSGFAFFAVGQPKDNYTGIEYIQLKSALARGWNTWNTNSVLSHVLLPEAVAIDFYLKDPNGAILKNALMGRRGSANETVWPLAHAYDGSYTSLIIAWHGIKWKLQSAANGRDISFLLTAEPGSSDGEIEVYPNKIWWNREGKIHTELNEINFHLPSGDINLYAVGRMPLQEGSGKEFLSFNLKDSIFLTTLKNSNADSVINRINDAQRSYAANMQRYGNSAEIYQAMQNVLAWDMIYDPEGKRELTTVSRLWNTYRGGYVIFCWDNYFAAYMHSLDNKKLAYSNAIEMTNAITPSGFVPNLSASKGIQSSDRSQPPVGSFVIREIYRHYREKWLLRELFPKLLTWNRWWVKNRDNYGFLCWGSNTFSPYLRNLDSNAHSRAGAALESGLDNSPMYDDIPFDTKTNQLLLADVGLMSLYIMDCDALADIAHELGRQDIVQELQLRAGKYRRNLAKLWDEKTGMYLNKRLDNGQFSAVLTPTNFYPLLARVPSSAQAKRMVKDHLLNPDEFWGGYAIPSVSYNDPDYGNDYWRGRIWAPMNFLVYLGLRNYDLPEARKALVKKSVDLFLYQWKTNGFICENYNGKTGVCDDARNCDLFYHWGGLLGFMELMENNFVPAPGSGLTKKNKR
jgi:hypothetical protein